MTKPLLQCITHHGQFSTVGDSPSIRGDKFLLMEKIYIHAFFAGGKEVKADADSSSSSRAMNTIQSHVPEVCMGIELDGVACK